MTKVCIAFCFIFAAYAALPAMAREPLTILSSDWPPFASNDAERPGFFLEVVREAFEISGFQVDFEYAPWARCKSAVEHGECFASLPFAKTASRESFAIFSRPVFMTRNPVLFNKNRMPDYDYMGIDSLGKYSLGGLLGWFYLKEWEKRGYKYSILKDQYTAFKMIDAGRVDLFVFDEFAGKYHLSLKPEFARTVAFSKTPYAEAKLYLMASKLYPGSEKLVSIFNANLLKLKENGFIAQVARTYDVPVELFVPQSP